VAQAMVDVEEKASYLTVTAGALHESWPDTL
jgi:hypothetical protein